MSRAVRISASWKRWLRRLATGLLAVELLYVGAFELAVRSGRFARWVNRRPEKVAIAFASAHSWFPFQVSIRGLDLRGQTSRLRWRLRLDEGRGWLSALPLLERRLRFAWVGARGVSFEMRHEAKGEPVEASIEASLPRIPALAPPPATPRAVRPKWSFELPRVRAEGVREIWIDRLKLTGELALKGGGAIRRGTEAELFESGLDLEAARLSLGPFEVGHRLGGHVDLEIARWPIRERRGAELLPLLSGRVAVDGESTAGSLLQSALLPDWFRFDPQPATFSARLELRSGTVQPGSRIALEPTACELGLFDFAAAGKALARVEVTSDASGARGVVDVRFEEFEVRRSTDPRAEIVGNGLSLVATTRDLALHPLPYAASVRIDLGEARLANLAVYDRLIPESLRLSILGGSGDVKGGLEVALPEQTTHAAFQARIEHAAVRYGKIDLQGSVEVDLALRSDRLASRTFDLAGSRIALTDFVSPQAQVAGPKGEPGWWAHIKLPEGRLVLPPAATASGRFVVDLRDSVPLVGLFATRRDLPDWVERVLSVKDAEARGRVEWVPAGLALEELSTRLRDATISGRARFGKRRKVGVMMIEWWKLALGVRFDDEQRRIERTKVREWFAAQDLGAIAPEPSP